MPLSAMRSITGTAAVKAAWAFQVLGVDGFHDVLDVGAHHGAQAGVVAATLLSLFGAFLAEGVLATVELLEKLGK